MTNATHNCTGCPVSAGTHKPADAVHTEIAEPIAKAQKQAEHIVLDLETLSTQPDAAIASIGAVALTASGNFVSEFHIAVDAGAPQHLRHVCPNTRAWWDKQSEEAKRASIHATDALPPDRALQAFSDWVTQHADPKKVKVWGNGSSFDNVILSSLYADYPELTRPWAYWNDRDMRTVLDLYPQAKQVGEFEGVKHNALHDARHEAKQLTAVLRDLPAAAELSTLRARCAAQDGVLREAQAGLEFAIATIQKHEGALNRDPNAGFVPSVVKAVQAVNSVLDGAELEAKAQGVPEGYALVPKRPTAAMEKIFMEEGWEWWEVLAAAEAITQAEYEDLAAAPSPAVPAPPAALAAVPLPLLLRDIARDHGITVPQACIALKPLGNYSTNSAVTAEMARMLRDHFPGPAPMPVAHPHHCTARTAEGSCEECEGHAQAMAEWNAERAALAATPAAPAALSDAEIIAAQEWARQTELESTLAAPAAEMRQRLDSKNLAEWADAGMGLAENITMHVQFDCTIRADQARHALRAHLFSQQPAGVPAAAPDALTQAELLEIKRAIQDWDDCGETDVAYELLMRGAKAGYLECSQFIPLRTSDLDAAIAAQAKGEQA